MACADWVLLCIGVNVSLLLGPGLKTNKLETQWEWPEGTSPEPSQTKPDIQRDQTQGYVLSTLINWLNSRGCGRSNIDLKIHPREMERGKEEEADCVQTQNNSNYLLMRLRRCWAHWHNNFKPTPWNSVIILDVSAMVTVQSGTKQRPDVFDFLGSIWNFLNCTTDVVRITVGFHWLHWLDAQRKTLKYLWVIIILTHREANTHTHAHSQNWHVHRSRQCGFSFLFKPADSGNVCKRPTKHFTIWQSVSQFPFPLFPSISYCIYLYNYCQ